MATPTKLLGPRMRDSLRLDLWDPAPRWRKGKSRSLGRLVIPAPRRKIWHGSAKQHPARYNAGREPGSSLKPHFLFPVCFRKVKVLKSLLGWMGQCRGDEWIGPSCQTRCGSPRLSKRTVRHLKPFPRLGHFCVNYCEAEESRIRIRICGLAPQRGKTY